MSFKKIAKGLAYTGIILASLAVPGTHNTNQNYQPKTRQNYSQTQAQRDTLERQLTQSKERLKKQSQTAGSLEELAKRGLPEEFTKMGFTVGDYVNRGSDKEVIILAENHISKDLMEKKKKILTYLAKNHGIDSVFLEGFSGEEPNLIPSQGLINIWDQEYLDTLKEQLSNNKVNPRFYGLENPALKKLLEESAPGFFGEPSKQELENLADSLTGLPENLPRTGIYYNQDGKKDQFKNNIGIRLKLRSQEFGKNIRNYAEKQKLNKILAITGAAHADMPVSEIGQMQDYFPYSYLVIYGPDTSKGVPEFFQTEGYKYNMSKDTFVSEIRKLKDL